MLLVLLLELLLLVAYLGVDLRDLQPVFLGVRQEFLFFGEQAAFLLSDELVVL